MSIEPFTAVAVCPKCGNVATHHWRMPIRVDLTPLAGDDPPTRLLRQLTALEREINTLALGSTRVFDDPDAEVIRQCACGHEWPQK